MIYPSEDVMGKLYALEAMPAKIDRIRTRIWTSIKAGN
jgi:putrescine transport system substrate-binding protein